MAYLESQVASLCGKAVHGWRMITHGDRVAVGLSGGKDSLTMLHLLAERRKRVPIDYTLVAMHIEMGFGVVDHQALADFCAERDVEFVLQTTDYGPRAHSPENRKNSPCFFCAMNRRKELFQLADQHGCGKLALAHHQDDIFETFFMNSLYAGSLGTMLPVQPFFRGRLVLIRPLALISAADTRRYAQRAGFPVQPPCCPSSTEGKRQYFRDWLDGVMKTNKKVRQNLWHALTNAGLASLPTPPTTAKAPPSKKKG